MSRGDSLGFQARGVIVQWVTVLELCLFYHFYEVFFVVQFSITLTKQPQHKYLDINLTFFF